MPTSLYLAKSLLCAVAAQWLTYSIRFHSIPSLLSENSREVYFEFDKVCGPPYSQEEVFEDISQLVQSALDGFTASLPVARYCVCVCVCVCGGEGLLVYPHRSSLE